MAALLIFADGDMCWDQRSEVTHDSRNIWHTFGEYLIWKMTKRDYTAITPNYALRIDNAKDMFVFSQWCDAANVAHGEEAVVGGSRAGRRSRRRDKTRRLTSARGSIMRRWARRRGVCVPEIVTTCFPRHTDHGKVSRISHLFHNKRTTYSERNTRHSFHVLRIFTSET